MKDTTINNNLGFKEIGILSGFFFIWLIVFSSYLPIQPKNHLAKKIQSLLPQGWRFFIHPAKYDQIQLYTLSENNTYKKVIHKHSVHRAGLDKRVTKEGMEISQILKNIPSSTFNSGYANFQYNDSLWLETDEIQFQTLKNPFDKPILLGPFIVTIQSTLPPLLLDKASKQVTCKWLAINLVP